LVVPDEVPLVDRVWMVWRMVTHSGADIARSAVEVGALPTQAPAA
jgi:hypothetical protein